jgi:predicted ArsR family transcriptional regulator
VILDDNGSRVLALLQDEPHGADSATLAKNLGLSQDVVERHLLDCASASLVAWNRHLNGLGRAMITTGGRDYLARQRPL